MKKPSFEKYVSNRDGQEQFDEGLFGKSDPNAPGWTASQGDKNRYAANQGVTKALPGFLKSLETLATFATPEKAAQMGREIQKITASDAAPGGNHFMEKQVAGASGAKG